MKTEVLTSMDLQLLPIVGLVIFMIIFIGISIRVVTSRQSDYYKHLAEIPFQKDQK